MVSGAAPTVTNGMVTPWMWDQRDASFVTYGAAAGFADAAITATVSTANTLTGGSFAATDIGRVTANQSLAAGTTVNLYALSLGASITLTTAADTTAGVSIGSGGLISTATALLTPALTFASGGEARIHACKRKQPEH